MEDSPAALKYNAQSPDEAALVEAARNFGYVFLGRTRDVLHCMVHGQRYNSRA
jgi:phospholipid-translocating ATPase